MAQGVPFRQRVRVPPLPSGLEWLNTGGPISLESLRGKFVLLDFWTYCCINCMHILPELEKLERAYPRELVVIGVHTAKFDAEREAERIAEAIRRYGIRHPVVNDKDRILWNIFGVNAWPTLILIDPEGYVVWGTSGETPFEVLDDILRRALPYYRQRGLVDETPLAFALELRRPRESPLYYPGKVLADPSSERLFIADSGHNRIVVTNFAGKVLDVIGSGGRGLIDGPFAEAQFNDPQGMALRGSILYVADTKNHAIRKVDLESKTVITIAGTGRQLQRPGPVRTSQPRAQRLASPWDLCIHGEYLYIAMAGTHQIWRLSLNEDILELFAGNGREDIVDGPVRPNRPFELGYASFAQPSGLASDGTWLFVADSEGSSIRAVPLSGRGEVRTVAGTAHLPYARLFTFGDVDGSGREARFQHPLGLALWEGTLFVADTYNNKIRRVDPQTGMTQSFVGGPGRGFSDNPPLFFEPGGISAAAGKLFVADTNNHAIRVIDLQTRAVQTLELVGLSPVEPASYVEENEVANRREISLTQTIRRSAPEGTLTLQIDLPIRPGWKLNPQAPISYLVEEQPSSQSLFDKAAVGRERVIKDAKDPLEVKLALSEGQGKSTVKITVNYFVCTEGKEGLCRIESATWIAPIEIAPDAEAVPITLAAE
ncbi:MAG: thioredoxin-like domain-containing protein [Thermoguttaceae bacterium]|nr:thioredoxin-like domain-containing protein [Thermoguttaceae bacterium]